MPFSMTHLSIAHAITLKSDKIKNTSDFILGAIAPDAIHFRDDFTYDMKKQSHFCVGDEAWGRVTNNDEWLENLLAYYNLNTGDSRSDFLKGYFCHIIRDLHNNLEIWTPFRLENQATMGKGVASQYHGESGHLDYEQYRMHPDIDSILNHIKAANAHDFSSYVRAEKVEKLRQAVLYEWYLDRELGDVDNHQYVKRDLMNTFIINTSEAVIDLLNL